ncbi:glycosyltransferase family 2 protein [Marinobacterium sediminicola]|uniref:Glycosyltransferase involved in cell wall bisynthesis n=1 Tax=Marinobacterium sediminicola TaxID=518898 RepID=A0ABY1RZ71_9GAMM|nr:glycosyltransferase family 2 protein [Marinobacterium sediminicola]ULG70866.1 glycosyltransferase family 2 protein [Marinobacterium sediminicola]SMR73631.1 Glycosyltransferase involved in cell wall bisynthesis [Marinobacterium sediminicola]
MKISLVIPVLNEEKAIPYFYRAVRASKELENFDIELVFVDDGSTDETANIIDALSVNDQNIVYIGLSRNFGKEAALFAGLEYASGDAVIPIDVDLQDPIEVIPRLVAKWQDGYDVVLAKRADRSSDHYLKRKTAQWFYQIHNAISSPKIEENVGDFRLMSRMVVEAIKQLPERKLFMKGVLSWVGFPTTVVEYSRAERVAGDSKFSGWKLWNLALDGITAFSTVPLRVWTYVGVIIALLAFFYAAWLVFEKLFWGNPVPGYPSIMAVMLFLGGIQLIGIGVLGEYIGRIYTEVKSRPRYIIKKANRPDIMNQAD